MAFFGHSFFSSLATNSPDLVPEEIQNIKDTLKFLRKDQLNFLLMLMMFNAAKEGTYVIGNSLPYGGVCLTSQISPSFAEEDISPYMWKIIRAFITEISK